MSIHISKAKALSILFTSTFLWLFSIVNAQESQRGYASFYHDKFQNRRTSSGEKFDNNSYTCAHRTLPFGTKIEVTNLANNKFVICTVTDRGPYKHNRLIDVTKRVAKELDFHHLGTAKVRIKVLDQQEQNIHSASLGMHTQEPLFGVSIGWFESLNSAEKTSQKINDEFKQQVYIYPIKTTEGFTYKLVAGAFLNRDSADRVHNDLLKSFPEAIVEIIDTTLPQINTK